jgi:hypothetical protein
MQDRECDFPEPWEPQRNADQGESVLRRTGVRGAAGWLVPLLLELLLASGTWPNTPYPQGRHPQFLNRWICPIAALGAGCMLAVFQDGLVPGQLFGRFRSLHREEVLPM